MANELIHATQGTTLTQAEFEAVGLHVLNSQATGDLIYASSITQLSRLGIGATDTILSVQGGIPSWRTPANILTDLTGQAGAAFSWNTQNLTSIDSLFLTEKASANADVAGSGQIWIKTVTPNELYFTDDAGNDIFAASNVGQEIIETIHRGILLPIPTVADNWTTTNVGSGGGTVQTTLIGCNTGATANSSSLKIIRIFGFNNADDLSTINWNKKLILIFNIQRDLSDAEAVARLQLKAVDTIGALGAKGFGIRLDNFALQGESYGTELGVVDLLTTFVTADQYQIKIVHDPSVPSLEWFVNGVSKGSQTTAAKMPTGTGGYYLAASIANGASGASSILYVTSPWLWGAR